MKNKPKMGRPPKPPGEKWVPLAVTMHPSAFRILEDRVQKANSSRGKILTELVLTSEVTKAMSEKA